MEINKEKLADSANQVVDSAKTALSKVDAQTAMKATTTFMAGVFKFGKVISALFMILFIVTMVGSFLYCIFSGSGSLKVPSFDDAKAEIEEALSAESGGNGNDVANREFKLLRKKYSDKIDSLIEVGGLDAKDDYDGILHMLGDLDKDVRDDFINGAISFLKGFKSYSKKNKDVEFDGDSGLQEFSQRFVAACADAEVSKAESSAKKTIGWIVCGGSLLGLILFLIIPLLIQIEENTRMSPTA
ncbi:MAG: hypothetical protein IJK04_09260 [Kiritimatiellae bacterium]|nr:hypothetical protein [Kiritimatiellia bacterium]